MVDKTLYPHVSFRNVSLHVNLGPEMITPLPFTCRTIQSASKGDIEIKATKLAQGEKCQVLFPIGIPDEGTFDWLDMFMTKNPNFVELSDRKIVEWCIKSGLRNPKSNAWKNSNDKPDVNFGIPALDELSAPSDSCSGSSRSP